MDSNTRDIYVLEEHEDRIVIGFGFRFFGDTAPETITHNDKKYLRGLMEAIPDTYGSQLCSARTYVLEHPAPSVKRVVVPSYAHIPKSEQENVLGAFWAMLLMFEDQAITSQSALDKLHTEQYFKLWNRVTGDTKKARWEK